MTINPLSGIQNSYFDSISNNNSSATSTSGSATLPQDSTSQLSPAASFLSQLQQLQQQDPAEFSQVTSSISTQLRQAAQTATSNGDYSQATDLNKLADQFQSASTGGALPTGHHHHHHGLSAGQYGAQGTQDTQSVLENTLSSTLSGNGATS